MRPKRRLDVEELVRLGTEHVEIERFHSPERGEEPHPVSAGDV